MMSKVIGWKRRICEQLMRQAAFEYVRYTRYTPKSKAYQSGKGECEGLIRAVAYVLGDGHFGIPTGEIMGVFNTTYLSTLQAIRAKQQETLYWQDEHRIAELPVRWTPAHEALLGDVDPVLGWLEGLAEERPVMVVDDLIQLRKAELRD